MDNTTTTCPGVSGGDAANPPSCAGLGGTQTYQSIYSVGGLPGYKPNVTGCVNNATTTCYYYCQSSAPLWSAHRDPSFGFAGLTFINDTAASFNWYRNKDQNPAPGNVLVSGDSATYIRSRPQLM